MNQTSCSRRMFQSLLGGRPICRIKGQHLGAKLRRFGAFVHGRPGKVDLLRLQTFMDPRVLEIRLQTWFKE